MGSLDANYALLSDVSARNRALQARLRDSLPLLWMDNALVMTSAVPRRRRAGLQPEQSAAAGEADQMLLALEGQAGLQVSRRYKRRVEWEVARRIARVDRELQQYPPAQRFWNQKRKEETPSRPSLYRQRAKAVERATGRQNARDVVEWRREEDSGERTTGVKTTRARRRDSSDKEVQKAWAKPRVVTGTSGDEKKQVKNVATSPLPIERGNIEDKENVVQNAGAPAMSGRSGMTKKEQLWNDPDSKQPTSTKLMDDLHTDEVKEEDNDTDEHVDALDAKSKTEVVPSQPVEADHDTTPQASSIPAENFVINARTEVLANVDQASDGDVASAINDSSPRRRKPQTEDRPSSSIGRQVLSDFRTMPSVASFGARPILSADGLGTRSNTRLNADVLRRLFSDLDTDKDGHVNRIETCMALHRLQISVSTAKIISFFRHIHSPAEEQAVRSRNTQHLPMTEVINYKEFVAFVTAAYDQQQQKKSERRSLPVQKRRNEDQNSALPQPAPSTSMPIYSRRTVSPRVKSSTQAHTPLAREQEVRVYEMPDADHEPDVLEERVIREIPNLLVSRMLSETTNEAGNEAAASLVRKSLESLVGKESVDDQTVKEITQELIRERLRNIGPFNQNDEEDVTGLRRAAAYYHEQMALGEFESSSVADGSSSEDLVHWVDVLTEEQVSGLVQRIWKDKQASLHHASMGAVEDSNIEDPRTDIPEDQTVSRIDEAIDTSELEVSRAAILSEKAVQASGDNDQGELTTILERASEIVLEKNQGEDAVSSTATIPRSNLTQTQLTRAIGTSLDPSGSGPHELFRPVTSIQILQQLRRQRRTHQAMQNSPTDDEASAIFQEPNVPNRGGDINATRMNPQMKTPLLSEEVDLESAASRSDITDPSHQHSQEEHDLLPLPTTEPVPLTEKFLDVGESVNNISSHEFVIRESISTSSSALSSTSDNHHLHGMYQEIDHLQHYTRSAPRRQRPRRRGRALSVSGSSLPDSLCSAELSEGEISRDEALELSDGEIYGESKRNYVKRKNATRGTMKSPDDEISLHNSIESGELPVMMEEIHAGFRRQLVAQSVTSSVESGEIEDGTVPG